MAELTDNYDFDPVRQGTTYERVTFELPQEDICLLTGASIFMQLRKSAGGICLAEFSTENSKIKILSAYAFCFEEQIINLAPDSYWYDILILFPDGRREIPLGGRWQILPSVTHKQ
jgi:hypothetical protein